jgi:hypothetical protein
MGNLTDYFRAPDDGAAAKSWERLGGPLVAGEGLPAFDGVDAKGIDASVALGRLVGFALEQEWSVRLMSEALIAPAMDSEAVETGPWVTRLSDVARDALAAIDPAAVEGLADRWAAIEEFRGRADPRQLSPVITELSALARRAAHAGEHLYCWSSL